MRCLSLIKSIDHLLMLAMALLASGVARADGGCSGHGGDGYSFDFYWTANAFISEVESWDAETLAGFPRLKIDTLKKALQNTKLIATDEILEVIDPSDILRARKIKVAALNDSTGFVPYIKINRALWDQLSKEPITKLGVVVHEYLGIMKGLLPQLGEWDEYSLSSDLVAQFLNESVTERVQKHENFLKTFPAIFAKAKLPTKLFTRESNGGGAVEIRSYSCVEHSVLKDVFVPIAKRNAIVANFWRDSKFEHHTEVVSNFFNSVNEYQFENNEISFASTFTQNNQKILHLRELKNGDLVAEVTMADRYENQPASTLDENRGVYSYVYCSDQGSRIMESLSMVADAVEKGLALYSDETYLQPFRNYLEDEVFQDLVKTCEIGQVMKVCDLMFPMLNKLYLPEHEVSDQIKLMEERLNTAVQVLPLAEKEQYISVKDKIIRSYRKKFADLTAIHQVEMGLTDLSNYKKGYMPVNVILKTMTFRMKEPAAEALRRQKSDHQRILRELILNFAPNP